MIVSITKRCTDCFRWRRLLGGGITGFNHQTVYRLLSDFVIGIRCRIKVSITKRCTDCFTSRGQRQIIAELFQSPNGVQIAFADSRRQNVENMFQSPNGVQIALSTIVPTPLSAKFQSPNGVQIALLWREQTKTIRTRVSITKRCTDCFFPLNISSHHFG